MPRAEKLQTRAARVGFDWDEIGPVLGKVHEELGELEEAMGTPHAEPELGDLLFSVVNLARHLDLDPELAARRAVDRFEERFREVERLAEGRLEEMTLAEMDELWEQAKAYRTE